MTSRESPGVVSIITDEEIEKSGAKDLLEVLRMVPGFYFGTDVHGIVGLVSRGMWTYEGKILLTVDGIEMNELAWGTTQIFNHYPVEQVKMIELIRGPGSAIYGGFAGLNVINIVTKKGADLKGSELSVTSGEMVEDYGHNQISMMYGTEIEGLSASVGGFFGRAKFSDRDYYYPSTEPNASVDLETGSRADPSFVNAGFEYKGFEFRAIQDLYRTTNRSLYFAPTNMEGELEFITRIVDAKKTFSFGDKFKVTPQYTYNEQQPYWNDDPSTDMIELNRNRFRITQKTARAIAEYTPTKEIHFLVGFEKRREEFQDYHFWSPHDNPGIYIPGVPLRSREIRESQASFAQIMYIPSIANFTAGLRNDKDNFSSTTVPRIAVTKVMGNFHTKLLVARSFRAPTHVALQMNLDLKPEIMTTVEVEAGYVLFGNSFFAVNLFDSKIKDPMAFDEEVYSNYEKAASRGAELDYRYVTEKLTINANYSYYQSVDTEADPLQPETTDKAIFGAPNNLAHLRLNYQVMKNIFVTPTAHYIGKIYTMVPDYSTGDLKEATQAQKGLLDLYVHARDLVFAGLDVGAGVTNAANTKEDFSQPYVKTGFHPPLPGPSRELYARISYSSEF